MITSVLICDTDIPSNLMDLAIKENKSILFEDIIITNQEHSRFLELKDFFCGSYICLCREFFKLPHLNLCKS